MTAPLPVRPQRLGRVEVVLGPDRRSLGGAGRPARPSSSAAFEENDKGSITAGKLVDFVVLAENPHDVDPDRIKEVRGVRTVVGGRTVFEA